MRTLLLSLALTLLSLPTQAAMPQPIEAPLNTLLTESCPVQLMRTPKKGVAPAIPPGSICIHKNVLNKDLIFGAVISNFEGEQINAGRRGMHSFMLDFLPNHLVRLQLWNGLNPPINICPSDPNNIAWLLIQTSPVHPWSDGAAVPNAMQRTLGCLPIQKVIDPWYAFQPADLAKNLLLAHSPDIEVMGSSGPERLNLALVKLHKDYIFESDTYWNFPVEVAGSAPKVGLKNFAMLIRFFLRAWQPTALLPKRAMHPSLGYFSLLQMYGIGSAFYGVHVKNFSNDSILRWRMDKPVVFTISQATPPAYRNAIKAGIESWNKPLLSLLGRPPGGASAWLRAGMEKEDEVIGPGDLRWNFVYWESDVMKGTSGARASWAHDPISGEIFHANAYLGGAALVETLENYYEEQSGQETRGNNSNKFEMPEHHGDSYKLEDPLQTLSAELRLHMGGSAFHSGCDMELSGLLASAGIAKLSKEQFIRDTLQSIAAHEIGHTLGLRHNFMGSLRNSSVMDYQPLSAYLDGQALKGPGAYDGQALAYGYAGRTPSTPAPFCTDFEALIRGRINLYFNPLCQLHDMGPNPLQSSIIKDMDMDFALTLMGQDPPEIFKHVNALNRKFFRTMDFLGPQASETDRVSANEGIMKLLRITSYRLPNGRTLDFNQATDWNFFRIQIVEQFLWGTQEMEPRSLVTADAFQTLQDLVLAEPALGMSMNMEMRETTLKGIAKYTGSEARVPGGQQTVEDLALETLVDIIAKIEKKLADQEQPVSRTEAVRLIRIRNLAKQFLGTPQSQNSGARRDPVNH